MTQAMQDSIVAVATVTALGYGVGIAFVTLILFTRKKGGE